MPIYDYRCSACGQLTEVVHGIHDHGPKFCPECGAEGTMTKGFAAPAIHFKGSGWAKKDRSSGSASTAATKTTTDSTDGTAAATDRSTKDKAAGDGKAASKEAKPASTSGSTD